MSTATDRVFLDAGVLIGAILIGDPRGPEAYPLIEDARRGSVLACTSVGVLSEVYAGLTWSGNTKAHSPSEAEHSIRELIEPPSAINVLSDGQDAALLHLRAADVHGLTARRIHDARHAATALSSGVSRVYTYYPDDWRVFEPDGIVTAGPPSTLARVARPSS